MYNSCTICYYLQPQHLVYVGYANQSNKYGEMAECSMSKGAGKRLLRINV
jgi:hypothetical protein